MIVGIRNEDISTKIKRHKKEALEQINAWKNELEFALTKDDADYKMYQNYCDFMFQTWENTLNFTGFPLFLCVW